MSVRNAIYRIQTQDIPQLYPLIPRRYCMPIPKQVSYEAPKSAKMRIYEALREKLIEIRPGKESRISEIDSIDIPQTYKMLAEIHATAVEFAFDKISADTILRLKDVNQRFEQAFLRRDIRGCRSCDNEFHDIIIKLAGNDFLSFFCETLSGHAARIENIYFSKVGDMDELIHEHKEIISAIESGDLERAKEFMRENWLHTPEVLEK